MIEPLKDKIQSAVDKTFIRMKWQKFRKGSFYRKVPLRLEHQNYLVKTVESLEELQEVLHLRYQVFISEGLNRKKPIKLDFEDYDFISDHLVVIDRKSNQIVGTYRLICSWFSERFYSQSEFNLENLLSQPGSKLELGRACIHKDFRNGSVIALLWRGLCTYMDLTQSKYLFGCASVKTIDPRLSSAIHHLMKSKNYLTDEYQVRPVAEFDLPGFDPHLEFSEEELVEAWKKVPTLVKSYMKAGARLEGYPAYDRAMQCVDFLTVLKLESLDTRHDLRFRE